MLAFAVTGIAVVTEPFLGRLDIWSGVAMFWGVVNMSLLWSITRLTVFETFGRFYKAPEPSERVTGLPAEPAAPTRVLGPLPQAPAPESVVREFSTAMRTLGYEV